LVKPSTINGSTTNCKAKN
jgi:hypothetical protein